MKPTKALDDRCQLWTGYELRHDLYNITKMEYLREMAKSIGVEHALEAAEWWLEQYPDDEEADEMRKFIEEMKSNSTNTEQPL